MPEDALDFAQINTGLDQMGRIAVAQAMGCNLFFIPQLATTLPKAFCRPARSSGVLAIAAFLTPPWRLGNNSVG